MFKRLQYYLTDQRIPTYMIIQESPRNRRIRLRRQAIRITFLAAIALLLLGVHQALKAEPSHQSTVSLNNVEAGAMLFDSQQAGRYITAVSQNSTAAIDVNGMIARVTLRQTFQNHTDDWQEGIYVFPLPDNAAVNEMRIRVGERIIEGEIKEKRVAKKMYQQAKAAGKATSLVEQQRPNMFRNRVANIGPGERIDVELVYLQTVAYDQGQFSLRFPMTITPRYIPGKPLTSTLENQDYTDTIEIDPANGWAMNTDQVSDATLITPFQEPDTTDKNQSNRIQINGTVNTGIPMESIHSAYHPITINKAKHTTHFELANHSERMTQDFVLQWRPKPSQRPQAAIFKEQIEGDIYTLLMLVPPQTSSLKTSALAKEQIFIIDTSGSMGGSSIQQAKLSLITALDQLKPGDRFNIIEFNSVMRPFFGHAVDVSAHSVEQARKKILGLNANGGTEMLPALKFAMRSNTEVENHRVRQIIFITDGAVGNEQALFAEIKNTLGQSRLFTVGIGSAPNTHFMRKAAQFGKGSFTHIGNTQEVSHVMQKLFQKLDSPVAKNITIDWPNGVHSDNTPHQIPDLYAGEPLVIGSKISSLSNKNNNINLVITGQTAGHTWAKNLVLNISANDHRGVSTVWARRKIASIMDKQANGQTPDDLRQQVLDIALPHKLLSQFTSFIAVDKTPTRPAIGQIKTSPMANAKPKGQTMQSYAYPQGSTSAGISIVWAIILLGLYSALHLRKNVGVVSTAIAHG